MNTKKIKTQWILSAAIGLTFAGSAFAQFRIDTANGRAHDANNRIGSNGYNQGGGNSSLYGNGNLGNQLITNSATGGRSFNFGNSSPYSDARSFRGSTANNVSDQFIKQSSAAPFGGVAQNNAQVVQPFYGSNLASAPPPGYVQQTPGSGAYVPSSASITRAPGDYRLGSITNTPLTQTPLPGQLVLPGPVDANVQSIITASPLYGVRSLSANSLSDQSYLSGNTRSSDINKQIDPTTLQRLRSELTEPPTNNRVTPNGSEPNDSSNGNPDSANPAPAPNQLQSTQLGTPFGQATNQPLDNRITSLAQGRVGNVGPLSNSLQQNVGINGGIVRNNLMAPERQSSQFFALNDRLKQYRDLQAKNSNKPSVGNAGKTDTGQPSGKNPNDLTPGSSASKTPSLPNQPLAATPRPGVVQPGGNTGIVPPAQGGSPVPPMPSVKANTPRPSDQMGLNNDLGSTLPKPVQIHSLAEGVQAKGLADVLKQAEDQTKAGRYRSALEQYDTAEEAAPNNPLIQLGRANVELAQSYYSRADQHLKDAFTKNPQLLMGQYDLKALLGNERLDYLVKDLKENAKANPTQARPLFLLAYIAYNTDNERAAAGYIGLAQQRAGNDDAVYQLIRQHWSLPPSQPENK